MLKGRIDTTVACLLSKMDSETDAGSFCNKEDEIPAEAKEVDDGNGIEQPA